MADSIADYRTIGSYFNQGLHESVFNRLNIGIEHQQRLEAYSLYWDFYLGHHFRDRVGEDESAQVVNFVRMFVDKIINSMTREFFKINLPEEYNELESILLDVWRDNEGELLILEILQMGSILGDVFIEVGWDENEKRPKISILPSFMVFPHINQFDYRLWDWVDVRFVVEIESPEQGIISPNLRTVRPRYKNVIKRYKKDSIEYYEDSLLEPTRVEPHDLGAIPIVHIKNYPLSAFPYGLSDLHDLISLNKEYNSKFSDVSDIIDYHAAPVTIIKGARIDTLEKGANRVWGGLPETAEVENLELNGDLGASGDHLDRIKSSMHEIAGVPKFIMGGEDIAVSNTSGVALSIIYGPLIEKARIKGVTYSKGIRDANFLVLRVLELKDPDFSKSQYDGLRKRDMQIQFTEPQPRDINIILEQLVLKFQLGLTTPRMALEELGTDNIEDILSQIEEYNKEKSQQVMEDFVTQTTHTANLDVQNKSHIQKQKDGKISGGGLPSGRRDAVGNNESIRNQKKPRV